MSDRECFTCTHCQKSLAGQRFTSRSVLHMSDLLQGMLHLHPLPEVTGLSALYIQSRSVVYMGVLLAQGGFTCTHCQKSLAAQRFTFRSVVYMGVLQE